LAGGEPAGGPGTSVVVRLTNDTVLTWLWTTQHWVSIEATAGGRADAASGWREATGGLSVAAAADAYWHFDSWSGGVSEAEQRMNPLTLSADRPRSVTAVFAANLATNGIPEWWLAQHGQTAPGFDEAAGADPDEDGQDTWKEYYAGTDPTNGESLLRIVGLDAGEGSNRLVWTAGTNGSGLPFRVDVRAVSGTNWMTAVTNWPRSPTLTNACWVATNGSGGVCFRVRVQREP
jgi:hypothetical protein